MGAEVLRDLSFQIAPKSFQFLTGPSGAGKSTLLKLLFMSLKPTRGLITVFDRDVGTIRKAELPALRRRIGVVFQEFRLLDHLTTFENVAMPLRVLGREEISYRADVIELLKWVGLGDRVHALPPILSGGEKQRAAIARALIGQPEILLPAARQAPSAPVRGAEPARNVRGDRHARYRPHEPVRCAPHGAA